MEFIKNNESKIKYICPNCCKNFGNKKSDYIRIKKIVVLVI